jgi:hypothetical protein
MGSGFIKIYFQLVFVLCFVASNAQKIISEKKNSELNGRLFENDDILRFKLIGKLSKLFNDRKNNMSYHPMLLQYKTEDSSNISIKLSVKTRGNFRRDANNCKMPPLLLNFSKSEKLKGSVFEDQKKLKLVVPCRGDEFVVREWLVYKLYNLLTEKVLEPGWYR